MALAATSNAENKLFIGGAWRPRARATTALRPIGRRPHLLAWLPAMQQRYSRLQLVNGLGREGMRRVRGTTGATG
jgi:hypothetical protein